MSSHEIAYSIASSEKSSAFHKPIFVQIYVRAVVVTALLLGKKRGWCKF